jgi:hypothetical protein
MPTGLPERGPEPKRRSDVEIRPLLIASVLLLTVVACICAKFYPPVAGYSLATSTAELQLSP